MRVDTELKRNMQMIVLLLCQVLRFGSDGLVKGIRLWYWKPDGVQWHCLKAVSDLKRLFDWKEIKRMIGNEEVNQKSTPGV